MIRAIAIDDEIPSLNVIKTFCSKFDFIDFQKAFFKPHEALQYLRQFPVDLIFLDINMPSISGIDLYKSISQKIPVIFTTAYSEYAVEGFNLNAIDYLLKPFTPERFEQAINKVNSYYKTQHVIQQDKFIFIRADYSLVKINTAEILFIEGKDDYIKIHLVNEKPLTVRMTLKTMLEKLPPDDFERVHRSFVIALSYIKSVRNKTVFIANEEIPIGSSYEENFLKRFNK